MSDFISAQLMQPAVSSTKLGELNRQIRESKNLVTYRKQKTTIRSNRQKIQKRSIKFCAQFLPGKKRAVGLLLTVVAAIVFVIAIVPSVFAADKHPFNLDDYSALRSARAVAISRDGKTILYRVAWDGTSGPVNKHEWRLIDLNGQNSRKLDLPEHFEPSGFTKDGALYGIYPVGKYPQLAMVPLEEGKLVQILSLPSGIRSATISPDGAHFAVLADPRKPDPLAAVRTVASADQTSLYVVSTNGADGGWWCPSLTDVAEIAWSSDGSQIAVISQWTKIGHHELHSFVDVCSASGPRRLAEIPDGTSGLAWTSSGKELVFASTTSAVITPEHIWTIPVSGAQPVDRTPDLPFTAVTLQGDPHGNIWVEMHKGVVIETYSYRDGKLEPAYHWPDGIIQGLPVYSRFSSSPAVLAFSVDDPSHATNVAVVSGDQLQKITHEGDDTLANVNLGEVKTVRWTSKDGIKLEGIATFPADYVQARNIRSWFCRTGARKVTMLSRSISSFARFQEWATWFCSRSIAVPQATAPNFWLRFINTSATAPTLTLIAPLTLPSPKAGQTLTASPFSDGAPAAS